MKKLFALAFALLLTCGAATAFGFGSVGNQVNANCPTQPYTGDCALCHVANRATNTPAKAASAAGNWAFFCPTTPPAPTCTDADNDGVFLEGGDCGPRDCNDFNSLIRPGASEICGDGIDQDCNGSDLACPPAPSCTDADQDGFSVQGGNCGPVDCNDNDKAINPGAAERCGDGIDNNCDGKIDGQDAIACPAPAPAPICTDADGDGFFAQSGCNTARDCRDNDGQIFPGAPEICGDRVDNDCDGQIDEGCSMGGAEDGATLYQSNCATCHGTLPDSNVCSEDAGDIMEAIAKNKGGMGYLSSLTDAQVKSIATAMAEQCKKSRGDDDDHDDRDKKKKSEKKRYEKKESEKKQRYGDRD